MDPEQIKLSELTPEQIDWITFAKSKEAETVLKTFREQSEAMLYEYGDMPPDNPTELAFLQGKRRMMQEIIDQIETWRGFDLDAAKQAEDPGHNRAASESGT